MTTADRYRICPNITWVSYSSAAIKIAGRHHLQRLEQVLKAYWTGVTAMRARPMPGIELGELATISRFLNIVVSKVSILLTLMSACSTKLPYVVGLCWIRHLPSGSLGARPLHRVTCLDEATRMLW